jgi:hypothetical protein
VSSFHSPSISKLVWCRNQSLTDIDPVDKLCSGNQISPIFAPGRRNDYRAMDVFQGFIPTTLGGYAQFPPEKEPFYGRLPSTVLKPPRADC